MNPSELLKKTRQYFWGLNFTEVETPYLNTSLPLESNLYTFQAENYFLPTSPEFALKKHLATTPENCFTIAHCFRHLEDTSPWHTPEFLMLEFYLVNQNLSALQDTLIKYLSLFLKFKIENYKLPENLPANEPDFNQFFLNEIEPKLPKDKAIFITGYPSFLSPLAKSNTDYQIAQRFELYINGIEIANGCEENRDYEQIKLAFEKELEYRQQNNLPSHPISYEFIKNCSLLPPSSGVGVGLDRLLKIINTSALR